MHRFAPLSSRTRIISDLHYGDPASWLQELGALLPLTEGVDHLIINGDALDTQVIDHAAEAVHTLKSGLSAHVPALTCITGNHDPDISDVHEQFLADNQIWVTHGDVFFDDIAPWGRLAPELRRRIHRYAGHPPSARELRQLETRFRIFRQVCLKLPREHDPKKKGLLYAAMKMARAVFPPHRLVAMIRAWRDLPAMAAKVSAEQRPEARVIITGHTHFKGQWLQPEARLVLNTGSFCPPGGGHVVDVVGDQIAVSKLARSKGEFRPGARIATYRVSPAAIVPRR